MKIITLKENPKLSAVYLADFGDGKLAEFADSVQPPQKIEEKWVILVSTLFGCPVGCKMCDAGNAIPYGGPISVEGMLAQIDYAVVKRFPEGLPKIKKFKIQFARMGEPSFNPDVIKVLRQLPKIYPNAGLLPSVSTIAPRGRDDFFAELKRVKDDLYSDGHFQLQFSIHTTDPQKRDWLIPIKKWDLSEVAEYGNKFYSLGDRKITLNFALSEDAPLDPDTLLKHFSPDKFLIKITPVNPTCEATKNQIKSFADSQNNIRNLKKGLEESGYEVIVSIGELEENEIGSNCGQLVMKYLKEKNGFRAKSTSYRYWN